MNFQDFGFVFDGVFESFNDLNLMVGHVPKPVAPSMTNSRQPIPGMYGDINQGIAYGAKLFNIPVTLLSESEEEYNDNIHNLASALIRPTNDGSEYELYFNSEPDVVYYGIFTDIPEPQYINEGSWDATMTLQFTCSDPQGYLPQETVQVDSEPFVFTPKGTGITNPIYYITPHSDVFEAGLAISSNDDAYVDVGYAVDPTETDTVVDKTPVVVSDPCNTLATWITPSTPPFDMSDDIDGSFTSNTDSISVAKDSKTNLYDYGDATKHKAWFGPLRVHEDLTDYLSNFRMKIRLHHKKGYKRGMSKSEAYLIGPSQQRVGRLYIQDESHGADSTLNLFVGPAGKELKFAKGMHYGPYTNNPNTLDKVVLKTKTTTKEKVGKGKSKKTKTVVKYKKQTENLVDYNNSNYFNDSFIEITITKIGLDVWLKVEQCDATNGAKTGRVILDDKQTLAKDADFSLRTIAYYAARYPITEDSIDPETKKPYKTYNYGFNSITNYAVEDMLDSSTTNDGTPKIIAHAGDTIVINTETHEVNLSTNGGIKSLNKYLSDGSTFPSLQGGIALEIGISPGVPDADIYLDYRPSYR